jgi:hypothetical protein
MWHSVVVYPSRCQPTTLSVVKEREISWKTNEFVQSFGVMTLAGKLAYWEENLFQYHFLHHKSHVERPGIETGPPWEANEPSDPWHEFAEILPSVKCMSFPHLQNRQRWKTIFFRHITKFYQTTPRHIPGNSTFCNYLTNGTRFDRIAVMLWYFSSRNFVNFFFFSWSLGWNHSL